MSKKKRKYADSLKIIADTDNVQVVTDPADAELADIMVCRAYVAPALLILPDNLIGACAKCGGSVQYRPHAPKRPQKVCDTCAFPIMEKERKKGDLVAMITPKTLDDVVSYMRKRWSN